MSRCRGQLPPARDLVARPTIFLPLGPTRQATKELWKTFQFRGISSSYFNHYGRGKTASRLQNVSLHFTAHNPDCFAALPTPLSRIPLSLLRAAHLSPTTSSRLPSFLAHGSSNVFFLCPTAGRLIGSSSSSSVSPSLSLTGLLNPNLERG